MRYGKIHPLLQAKGNNRAALIRGLYDAYRTWGIEEKGFRLLCDRLWRCSRIQGICIRLKCALKMKFMQENTMMVVGKTS
jgi:hypothetical protein